MISRAIAYLFAAEVHKTVEVFDLNERIHSITGFGTPHEILFRPDTNTLIVADGGADSSVKLVDGKNYQIIDSIKLPPGVDSAEYNPVAQEYYVENRGPDASANTHMIRSLTQRISSIPAISL